MKKGYKEVCEEESYKTEYEEKIKKENRIVEEEFLDDKKRSLKGFKKISPHRCFGIPTPVFDIEDLGSLIDKHYIDIEDYIDRELKEKINENKDLKKSLQNAFLKIKNELGCDNFKAEIEKDRDNPDFKKVLLTVNVNADDVEEWKEKEKQIRKLVRKSENDEIIFTRVLKN